MAISVILFLTIRLESRTPCQKEVKRRLRTKALRWRKRDHAWWRAIRGVRKSLHKVLGSLVIPENTDERKEVEIASRKLVRPDSRSEGGYSQASRQENVPIASRKLVREDQLQTERNNFNSNSTRKLAASSPELRNMEYTNHQHMSKIFQFSAKEIGNVSKRGNILNASIQNTCIDMENVHVFVDESRHPSCAELFVEFGDLQEQKKSRRLKACSTLLKSW